MGSGVDILYLNTANASSLAGNTVTAQPYIQFVEQKSAQYLSGREPGGPNYKANSASNGTLYVGTSTVNGNILLMDQIETSCANLGYAKNVAWLVTLNATAATTLNLFALSTNATTVGANAIQLITDSATGTPYTNMNNANMIITRNLDPVNTLKVAPTTANGVPVTTSVNGARNVPALSADVYENTGNGVALSNSAATITLTGNAGQCVVILMGS